MVIPTLRRKFTEVPGLYDQLKEIIESIRNLNKDNFRDYPDMAGVNLTNVASIGLTAVTIGDYTLTVNEFQYLVGQDQSIKKTDSVTVKDITITTPVNVYALSHNAFANYVANQHVAHTGTNLVSQIADRILTYNNDVLCAGGDILYA